MAIGRFGGDAAVQRFGPVRTVRTGGVVAVVGVVVLLASGWTWSAVLGFGLVGLGVSTVVPLAFAAAGRLGGDYPGQQIAAVATLGYGAGMATPALVGAVTELSSIQVAFALVGVLLVVVVALAPRLRT
jgi:fucose permease